MVEQLTIDINTYTVSLILLIFTEILILIPFKKDKAGWKWRTKTCTTSTWKPALYFMIIIASFIALGPILNQVLEDELENFSYTFLLAPPAFLIGFVWIWNVMIGKNINRSMIIFLIISLIFIGFFLWGNFDFLNEIYSKIFLLSN